MISMQSKNDVDIIVLEKFREIISMEQFRVFEETLEANSFNVRPINNK